MVNKYMLHVFDNGECAIIQEGTESEEDMQGVQSRTDLFLSPKYRVSKKSNIPLINESTNDLEYLTLDIQAPVDGDYQINWYLEWSLNSTSNDFKCKLQMDNEILAQMIQEPKDAAGSGDILGSVLDSKTNQRLPYSGETEVTLTEGSHSIKIYFSSDKKNKTATIYRAYMKCERVN